MDNQGFVMLFVQATVVKSCPCVSEDNPSAIASDREGKPLVMVCLHPDQSAFVSYKTFIIKERAGNEEI